MKQFKTIALAILALPLLLLSSCDDGAITPVKPEDETKNLLHDSPRKIEMILTKGSMSGSEFVASNATEGQRLKNVQKITYGIASDGGFKLDDTSQKAFIVQSGNQNHYQLVIRFFDDKGNSITEQFLTNGQEKIHQFFFVSEINNTYGDGVSATKETRLANYIYTDQVNGKPLGAQEPVGFNGIFNFLQPYISMYLHVDLFHFKVDSKLGQDQKLVPFDAPTKWLKQRASIDFACKLLLFVVGDANYNYGTNATHDNSTVDALMNTFNIDKETAINEAKKLF